MHVFMGGGGGGGGGGRGGSLLLIACQFFFFFPLNSCVSNTFRCRWVSPLVIHAQSHVSTLGLYISATRAPYINARTESDYF